MSASASLFAVLSPAVAPGETPSHAHGLAAGADYAGDSFHDIMSQASGQGASAPSTPAQAQPQSASNASSNPTGDSTEPAATTLAAVIARTHHHPTAHANQGLPQARALANSFPANDAPAKKTSTPSTPQPQKTVVPGEPQPQTPALAPSQRRAPAPTDQKANSGGDDAKGKPESSSKTSDDGTTAPAPAVVAPTIDAGIPLSIILSAMLQQPQAATQTLHPLKGGTHGGDASDPSVDPVSSSGGKASPANSASEPEKKDTKAAGEKVTSAAVSARAQSTQKNLPGLAQIPPSLKMADSKVEDKGVVKPQSVTDVSSQAPPDGTGGALSNPRMSFTGEKNEIAASAAQKVPGTAAKDAYSGAAQAQGGAAGVSTASVSATAKGSIDPTAAAVITVKSADGNFDTGKTISASAPADSAAAQAERLGNMVSRQVTMIRQSGSDHLAVSLKLDPQTEVNLQLTNHNGQIEASVRWERGGVPGMESHWKDLQDSLAKQNVQLLPLENKSPARNPGNYSQSQPDASSSYRDAGQNPQGRGRETRQTPAVADNLGTVQTAGKTSTTTRTVSRQGWESWA